MMGESERRDAPGSATPAPSRPPAAEVAWDGSNGRPIGMLDFDKQRRLAFLCLQLPLREAAAGAAHASTKPYLLVSGPGVRHLIPLELVAIPLEQEPVFIGGVEPRWPVRQLEAFLRGEEPPTIAAVFAEVEGIVRKYVDLPDPLDAKIVSLYILLTCTFPLFDGGIPFLKLEGTKGSGKSKLCAILASLSHNAVFTSSVSEAALYRIASARGLLCIDEAEGMRKTLACLLNASYRKGALVIRAGTRGRLEQFSAWGPKVISAILPLPDTVASRSIIIRMVPTRSTERARIAVTETSEPFAEIRGRIYAAVFGRWHEIDTAVEAKITGSPRSAEIWTPMLALAHAAGGEALAKEVSDYAARAVAPAVPSIALSDADRLLVTALTRLTANGMVAEVSTADILAAMRVVDTVASLPSSQNVGFAMERLRLFRSRRHTAAGRRFTLDVGRIAELAAQVGSGT